MTWWQIGLLAWATTASGLFALLATELQAASAEELDGKRPLLARSEAAVEVSAAGGGAST